MFQAHYLQTGYWAVKEPTGRLVRKPDGMVWKFLTHGEAYALAKQKERAHGNGTVSGRGAPRGRC